MAENPSYHNIMEDVALRHLDGVLEADGGCRCAACRADVMALALNPLQPHYVVSDKGRMLVQLNSYDGQFRTDVVAALSQARQVVRARPRHG